MENAVEEQKYILENAPSSELQGKPFSCDYCDVKFASQRNRIRHIKEKHTRHKFPCLKCQRPFNRLSYMKIHEKNCPGPKINCDICDKKFTSFERYNIHMQSHNKGYRRKGRGVMNGEGDPTWNESERTERYKLTKEERRYLSEYANRFTDPQRPLTVMVESTDLQQAFSAAVTGEVGPLTSPVKSEGRSEEYMFKDDSESFAMSLVPTFRRLSQRKLQMAKIQINQLLFELEYGDYDLETDEEEEPINIVVQQHERSDLEDEV